MTVSDIDTYFHEEKYGIFVVQAFNKTCYRFNITCADNHATAVQIILDRDNFIVSGWKVARKLPKWIHKNHEWDEFINKKYTDNS
jgi:hypothetical protein